MSNNNQPEKANEGNDIILEKIQDMGFKYIKNETNYLIISALFPVFAIFVQILNFIFILNTQQQLPPPPPDRGLAFVDTVTPLVIMLVISSFALFNFYFLLKWRKKIDLFEKQRAIMPENNLKGSRNGDFPKTIPLTGLFYDIIDHVSNIKKIFYGLNIIVVFNLQWYIRYFLIELRLIFPDHPPPPIPLPELIQILNFLCQISLFLYLAYEWKHFLQWNKRLSRLSFLEQSVYHELDL
ncbi:MAG: hypothetical protein ACFFD4_35795 [Candidatus Odinarchaeota archaeon]